MSNSVSRSYSKNNEDASLRQEITISPSLLNAWSARLAEQVPFCPCPPETLDCAFKSDLSKVDGGIPFFEFHVDPDIPFCPACELAQLDLDVLYSCQCAEVW